MWKQLITPNFDPYIVQGRVTLNSWLGWCMAYVEQSVKQFYVYATALAGWSKVKGRHNGQPPANVWVPLWYSGYKGQGHVLWAKVDANGKGTAYTSPNTRKPYADRLTFNGMADLTAKLQRGWAADIKFLGWSEYVGKAQIVKWVAAAPPKPRAKKLYLPKVATRWYVYPTNKKPVVGNQCGILNPSLFGGLTYDVLATPHKDVVTIQTRDYGRVNIYVGPGTGAVIK